MRSPSECRPDGSRITSATSLRSPVFGADEAAQPSQENVFGTEVLQTYGAYAMRPASDDPWLPGPGAWEDDAEAKRIVRTVRVIRV